MTVISDLVTSYNTQAEKLFNDLDAAHVDLVELLAIKDQIAALSKADAQSVEAQVAVPVIEVGTIHDAIKTARRLIGEGTQSGNGKAMLENAGLTVYDWDAEWSARSASRA